MVESIEILTVKQHFEGNLKGFYTVSFANDDRPLMKSKRKSALLAKLSKYYRSQEE